MDERETAELLPCPFCGGEARGRTGSRSSWVECSVCEIGTKYSADAASMWNKRTASTAWVPGDKPKDAGKYLVTYRWATDKRGFRGVTTDYWSGKWWEIDVMERPVIERRTVFAYQPLPEPFHTPEEQK